MNHSKLFCAFLLAGALPVVGQEIPAITDAAASGNVAKVSELLKQGVSVNTQESDGSTALMCAVQNGRAEVANLLLKSGADVNLANKAGSTALVLAAFYGKKDIVTSLLDKGAKINANDKNGHGPLFYATFAGNDDVSNILIDRGADQREKVEKSKFLVKGEITKINVAERSFSVKIKEGPFLFAKDAKDGLFTVSKSTVYVGGAHDSSDRSLGFSGLKINDVVKIFYTTEVAVKSLDFAGSSASGVSTNSAQMILVVNK